MSEKFRQVLQGSAHVIIGKNGLTPGQLENIKTLLKQAKVIKIKVMKEIAHDEGIDGFIAMLMRELDCFVLDARGFTFIISKKKIPGVNLPKRFSKLLSDGLSSPEGESESQKLDDGEADEIDGDKEELSDGEDTEESEIKDKEAQAAKAIGTKKKVLSKMDPTKTDALEPEVQQILKQHYNDEYIDYDNPELINAIDREADKVFKPTTNLTKRLDRRESRRSDVTSEKRKVSRKKTD